ncbi:MAG: type I restriction enzyme HsdR N-terminal domain-containing protein, partial [Alphaproteobacteria bacterium]|nr:type I restriction enzyme HsdR N-terminal domain-containing protein [Alphaproteobacteria bacterium]
MKNAERQAAIRGFIKYWKDRGYEKRETNEFWLQLLQNVLNVEFPNISFQKQIKIRKNTYYYIDAYIEQTKVLIEQKSSEKSLSDETFQQAKRYANNLPHDEHPRWIVLCNFQKFLIYDMNRPNDDPQEILLENLEKDYTKLLFLVQSNNNHITKEEEISEKAGEVVERLYDALSKQYKDSTNPNSLKSLNILCVRIVFCLYAEDAEVFGKDQFLNYLKDFQAPYLRNALMDLFKVLNTPLDKRDPYLGEKLRDFPYVNGGLFADEDIEIPNFTEEMRDILLTQASQNFDWSKISPTIFGALFESTINPETRRSVGVHYTSIENIHKVIDPLFLDDLKAEFEKINQLPKGDSRRKKMLLRFQDKISQLRFLDPSCGSGNFLTETYISLRRLENKILREVYSQGFLGDIVNPIKVSIKQFYGIEINDFAVSVARAALWISESQMLKETEDIVPVDLDFLPLKTNANIVEANALRIDWETVIPKDDLFCIMGNPPYGGYVYTTPEQREDLALVYLYINGKPYKHSKKNDYVACWYFKAAQFMQGTSIKAAFVSTNSITQGEQVVS